MLRRSENDRWFGRALDPANSNGRLCAIDPRPDNGRPPCPEIARSLTLILVYGAASFAHNEMYIDAYPNPPAWITPVGVCLSWLAIAGTAHATQTMPWLQLQAKSCSDCATIRQSLDTQQLTAPLGVLTHSRPTTTGPRKERLMNTS
jgi:hypothetical protein